MSEALIGSARREYTKSIHYIGRNFSRCKILDIRNIEVPPHGQLTIATTSRYTISNAEVGFTMHNLTVMSLMLVSTAATGADLGCKGNPSLTGQCYAAHGEIEPSADLGYVFAQTGSKRSFVVRAAPQSEHDAPTSVWAKFRNKPLSTVVTGDFVVCPIPNQPSQFTLGKSAISASTLPQTLQFSPDDDRPTRVNRIRTPVPCSSVHDVK